MLSPESGCKARVCDRVQVPSRSEYKIQVAASQRIMYEVVSSASLSTLQP